MASQGPNSPGSVSNVTFTGIAWTNPSNAATNNSSYATVALNNGEQADYLTATNFGFSIPSDATITGVQVDLKGMTPAGTGVNSNSNLLKAGSAVGSTRQVVLTTVDQYWPMGLASSDMWGTTLTPAEANASNFGVRNSFYNADVNTRGIYIDHIQMTIGYTQPATGGMFFGFVRKAWELLTGKRRIKTQVRTFRPQPAFAGV